MTDAVKSLVEYCQEHNRVCPRPRPWNKMFDVLSRRLVSGLVSDPPPPLILGAWWESSELQKQCRLTEQIEWAAEHGLLDSISVFLRELAEEDWHHNKD